MPNEGAPTNSTAAQGDGTEATDTAPATDATSAGDGAAPGTGDAPSDTPNPEADPLAAALAAVEEWKAHSRRHEQNARNQRQRAEENAEAARQLEALRLQQMTDQERAVAEAFQNGRTEALTQVGKQLVAAEFKVAAAGRLEAERLDVLLGGVDLGRFLGDDASVRVDDIAAFVDGIAPRPAQQPLSPLVNPAPAAPPAAPPPPPAAPDLGQGAGRGTPPGLNEDDPLLAGLKGILNIK